MVRRSPHVGGGCSGLSGQRHARRQALVVSIFARRVLKRVAHKDHEQKHLRMRRWSRSLGRRRRWFFATGLHLCSQRTRSRLCASAGILTWLAALGIRRRQRHGSRALGIAHLSQTPRINGMRVLDVVRYDSGPADRMIDWFVREPRWQIDALPCASGAQTVRRCRSRQN